MKPFLWGILLTLPMAAQVRVTEHGSERISVEIEGRPFTDFFIGPETNKPYLHPLRSASGKMVTRGYPMENIAGETHDHPHHRGLWFSHGDVNGYNFWANEPSQHSANTGKIVLRNFGWIAGGKEAGTIEATFDWVDPQGKPLLTESRKMTFYADPARRVIDFDIALAANGK